MSPGAAFHPRSFVPPRITTCVGWCISTADRNRIAISPVSSPQIPLTDTRTAGPVNSCRNRPYGVSVP